VSRDDAGGGGHGDGGYGGGTGAGRGVGCREGRAGRTRSGETKAAGRSAATWRPGGRGLSCEPQGARAASRRTSCDGEIIVQPERAHRTGSPVRSGSFRLVRSALSRCPARSREAELRAHGDRRASPSGSPVAADPAGRLWFPLIVSDPCPALTTAPPPGPPPVPRQAPVGGRRRRRHRGNTAQHIARRIGE